MARNYEVGISFSHTLSPTLQVFLAPQDYDYANGIVVDQDAITALNSLQSNFAIVDAIRKSGMGMNKMAIPEMIDWCQKLGYQVCERPSIFCFNNWERIRYIQGVQSVLITIGLSSRRT